MTCQMTAPDPSVVCVSAPSVPDWVTPIGGVKTTGTPAFGRPEGWPTTTSRSATVGSVGNVGEGDGLGPTGLLPQAVTATKLRTRTYHMTASVARGVPSVCTQRSAR